MAILAGEKATAARINEEIGVALSDTQNTSGTTTSTSYTPTLTGGTACGKAFVAPPSGKVLIYNTVELSNSGANNTRCTIHVRTGSTVGSGTDVLAAADAEAILHNGTTAERNTVERLLTGLTAGNDYNVQQEFKVAAGTGTFLNKHLTVKPQL